MIVLLDVISDPDELAEYRRIGLPTLEGTSAEFLVRNGRFEALEGPPPQGVFMIAFPSMEEAKAWYDSPRYQQALQHRFRGARCRAILVEGIAS